VPEQIRAPPFFNSAPFPDFIRGTVRDYQSRVSLTELMVTVVILAWGVLGLAAAANSAQRAMVRGRLRTGAAARAGVTVDSLRDRSCRLGAGASGSNREESWTVELRGSLRYIVDSVQADHRGFVVVGAAVCP